MVNIDKWYIKMYTTVSAPKTSHRTDNKANNVRRNFRAKPIRQSRNNSMNNVSAHTTITSIYILQLSEGSSLHMLIKKKNTSVAVHDLVCEG